jgi:LmbE family N-acetylglucosaminyl deacetylase
LDRRRYRSRVPRRDPTVDRRALAATRREEQTAAAKTLGVDRVEFLGYPDGQVETTRKLRSDISRAIRRFRPDRVICQSPERRWDFLPASHPDHLATGEAALRAVYPDARNPFAHPELLEEGLEPFTVRELWVVAHPDPNVAIDVTDNFERKMAALKCHASQIAGPGTSIPPSPPGAQQTKSIWRTRRALALHVTLAITFSGFLALGWWQLQRALDGNSLSWAYTFEWPFFAGYAVFVWWRLVHEVDDEATPESDRPAPSWIERFRRRSTTDASDDAALAEYNAYLAALRASHPQKEEPQSDDR